MTQELDELLQPTVAAPAREGPRPWRVNSQFWVAFFGGVPAVTAIAFLNARRLGADAAKRRWILLAGVVALLVSFIVGAWLGMEEHRRTARIAMRVIAVLLFLVLARIQRDDDGRHQVFGSGEYASLWVPGILATVLSGVVMVGVLVLAWTVLT